MYHMSCMFVVCYFAILRSTLVVVVLFCREMLLQSWVHDASVQVAPDRPIVVVTARSSLRICAITLHMQSPLHRFEDVIFCLAGGHGRGL